MKNSYVVMSFDDLEWLNRELIKIKALTMPPGAKDESAPKNETELIELIDERFSKIQEVVELIQKEIING